MSRYLQLRGGTYYYVRKIPLELRSRFNGKTFSRRSLRTSDPAKAAVEASKQAAADDAVWRAMLADERLSAPEIRKAALALLGRFADTSDFREEDRRYPGQFSTWSKAAVMDEVLWGDPIHGTEVYKEAIRLANGPKPVPFLSEALAIYLSEHPKRGDKAFEKITRYGIELVFQKLGDRPMDTYSRSEVLSLRDAVRPTMKTATLTRRLEAINAVFNKACAEFQLSIPNPFAKVTIHGIGLDSQQRDTYTASDLLTIRDAATALDDDIRWIIGLQIETGARLGEIVGLRCDDVDLSALVPHLKIRPHLKFGRTLKNKQSERDVPLVGVSLWAAQRALEASPSGWLFPRYSSDNAIKATYASNTLVKWLKKTVGRDEGIGNHSFRHTMLDRLRNSGCPEDAAKQMVGHGDQTITRGYGKGYSLEVLRGYLEAAQLPD